MSNFATISAILWTASSIAWAWAAFVKSPIEKHPSGEERGIAMYSGGGDNGSFNLLGMKDPSFTEFNRYFTSSARRNAIAAAVSALAAFFALLAILFPSF
ncbi:hypothetical protein KQ944_18275 [Bacillus subtilis]|uniref:hypothetical protein n=1 Tax=Pseudochrobactrum asaccharolyticum TaxID=354351 RepID=UPI001F3DD44C|nr:hypothetical protein [Pseudochrobactrum asaccharolyticum]MCF7647296.1 hypothetical protein [Pseudochrobactrum asaccharolyticum]MCF7673587.1 hypothetical protein [Bacillus subtilis]